MNPTNLITCKVCTYLDLRHILLDQSSLLELPCKVRPIHRLDELGNAGKVQRKHLVRVGHLLGGGGTGQKGVGRFALRTLDQRQGEGFAGLHGAGVAGEDGIDRCHDARAAATAGSWLVGRHLDVVFYEAA